MLSVFTHLLLLPRNNLKVQINCADIGIDYVWISKLIKNILDNNTVNLNILFSIDTLNK